MNLVSGVRSTLGGIEENGKAHAVSFLSDTQGSRKSAMYIIKRKDMLKIRKMRKTIKKPYQDCLDMLCLSLKSLYTVMEAI